MLISRINKNNGAQSLVHSKQNYSMLLLMPRLIALLWGFSAANKCDNLDFVLNVFKYDHFDILGNILMQSFAMWLQ